MVTKSIAIQPYPWWSRLPYWRGGMALLAAFLALPLLTVLGFSLQPAGDVWRHLQQTVLAEYVCNSLLLALGVGDDVSGHGQGKEQSPLHKAPPRKLTQTGQPGRANTDHQGACAYT